MCVYRRMGIVLLISCMVLVLGSCGDKKTDMTEVADRVEKMVTGNNPLQVKTVSQDKYAYNTLDDATKLVYDEILYAIVHRKKEVQIATTDVEQMELAYLAVRYDYCDLFWLKQFSYVTYSRDDEITAIEITPEYSMTAAEQKKTQKAIDKEADRMLADAPKEGSDYEKALYVFEKLIDEVDYVEDSADNQNIISVFLNHETICQGYAYATQYLLEKLGVSCTTVIGNVSDGPHAWCSWTEHIIIWILPGVIPSICPGSRNKKNLCFPNMWTTIISGLPQQILCSPIHRTAGFRCRNVQR